jgi:hypothetical protein
MPAVAAMLAWLLSAVRMRKTGEHAGMQFVLQGLLDTAIHLAFKLDVRIGQAALAAAVEMRETCLAEASGAEASGVEASGVEASGRENQQAAEAPAIGDSSSGAESRTDDAPDAAPSASLGIFNRHRPHPGRAVLPLRRPRGWRFPQAADPLPSAGPSHTPSPAFAAYPDRWRKSGMGCLDLGLS